MADDTVCGGGGDTDDSPADDEIDRIGASVFAASRDGDLSHLRSSTSHTDS